MVEETTKKAGRPATKKEETVKVENTNNDVMELLKQMQAELASLKKENESLKKNEKSVAHEEMSNDTEVEVMSLYAGTMNLYTEGFGNGQKYSFTDGYGSIIDIPLGDLKQIVKNNSKIAKDGYFYIMNEDVVSICRLKKAYENLLSYEQMEKLSKATDDQVVRLYESAPDSQKELIVEYFANKKANNESVSSSLLYRLEELSGKKLIEK